MEEEEGEEKGQEEEKPVKHAWKTPGNRKEETTEQKAAPAAETQQADAAGPTPASGLSVGPELQQGTLLPKMSLLLWVSEMVCLGSRRCMGFESAGD